MAQTQGFLQPEEIKRIRKKLGLTQEAAGEIIGVGRAPSRNMNPATRRRAAPLAAPWFSWITTPRHRPC